MILLKEQIFEASHLNESSESCRGYFKQGGLSYGDVTGADLETLKRCIQKEIDALLADESYQMVPRLRMHIRITSQFNPRVGLLDAFLFVDGSYFKRREAISFYEDGFIGLCGWASGCNRIPFVRGFVEWCDLLKTRKEQTVDIGVKS